MYPFLTDTLEELLKAGAFRFEGRHEAVMDVRGKFRLPEEWGDLVSSKDVYEFITVYDELAGQVVVYFEEDEPSQDKLFGLYSEFTKRAAKHGAELSPDDLSPYPFMNYFDQIYRDGAVKISPKLFRGFSIEDLKAKTLADKPFDITVQGFGHGFTIERSDGAWKRDSKIKPRDGGPLWNRVFALKPVINSVMALQGYNPIERDVLSTIRPSGHGQNQIDRPSDDASGAPLPGLAELS